MIQELAIMLSAKEEIPVKVKALAILILLFCTSFHSRRWCKCVVFETAK
jgi:hypothetical protein